jgi:heme-degrading monooxygenase HmoA
MVYITVAYGVEDYDKWKLGFDSYDEVRKTSGCLSTTVYVSPDDRNSLNIVFEWDSKENFVKWVNSPELKEGKAKSGSTSPPTIKFWDLHTE